MYIVIQFFAQTYVHSLARSIYGGSISRQREKLEKRQQGLKCARNFDCGADSKVLDDPQVVD